MGNYLEQVTCIENIESHGEVFDKFLECIKTGEAKKVVFEMLSWGCRSDLDPYTYENIVGWALHTGERIVYDDGEYVLTANESNIVLYEYLTAQDKLGDKLECGDKVIWVDPDIEGRDLNRIWEVTDIHSEELIWIGDETSEAEVPPSEVILAKTIFFGKN